MRLLIIQLSDIHIRRAGNPIVERLDALLAAIRSIIPRPDACLLLLTGDIVWSGHNEEFDAASLFLKDLEKHLSVDFQGNIYVGIVPGNHDCFLPEEDEELRRLTVEGSRSQFLAAVPNSGVLKGLLAPQANFLRFFESHTGRKLNRESEICRADEFMLGDKLIRLISFNTALVSQRAEVVGTLAMPLAVIKDVVASPTTSDLTISVFHHPENWLDPAFHREFRKIVETTSHIAFTGHEHQQDSHWSESGSGEHLTMIEADALQDKSYPRRSGFNSLVIDFESSQEIYFHFRWVGSRYSAIVDGKVHDLILDSKSVEIFVNTEKFHAFLKDDEFGFSHQNKPSLQLADFYVYPSLVVDLTVPGKSRTIRGGDVLKFVLQEKSIYLRGEERIGKTSLLKTLYRDILETSPRVPVYVLGESLSSGTSGSAFRSIWNSVADQYGPEAVERYKQLPVARRVVFIDNIEKSRLSSDVYGLLISELTKYFGLVIVTTSITFTTKDFTSALEEAEESPFTVVASIKELPPSIRSQIIDKWLRIGRGETIEEDSYARELEREQNLLSDLIRRKGLPSYPYLILGVLQIRQNTKDDSVDPGSFGFLFQRLVIDALSVSKSKKKNIDKKDGILRRFAFALFKARSETGSLDDFERSVEEYRMAIKIKVDSQAILDDLLSARVLRIVDGILSFRHHYFFHYFLAKQILDCVDSDRPEEARQLLEDMADRPLIRSNQLTLIFYLFFKRRDPIIDKLIALADDTFKDQPELDMVCDLKFIDSGVHVPKQAKINESVNVKEEREKRNVDEDKTEEAPVNRPENSLEERYSESLALSLKVRFAYSRIEMLGQLIRSFPGALEGDKKIEILESVFRLGLRTMHTILILIDATGKSFIAKAAKMEDPQERTRNEALIGEVLALLARIYCVSIFLLISRSVGTSDIEETYEAAVQNVGDTFASQIIGLAIKLDHSDGFPLKAFETLHRRVAKESRMTSAMISDLVQRHTQIFPLHKETLRQIAGVLRVNAVELLENSGSVRS